MLGGIFLIGSSLFLLLLSLLARGIGANGGLLLIFSDMIPYALGGLAYGIFICWRESR